MSFVVTSGATSLTQPGWGGGGSGISNAEKATTGRDLPSSNTVKSAAVRPFTGRRFLSRTETSSRTSSDLARNVGVCCITASTANQAERDRGQQETGPWDSGDCSACARAYYRSMPRLLLVRGRGCVGSCVGVQHHRSRTRAGRTDHGPDHRRANRQGRRDALDGAPAADVGGLQRQAARGQRSRRGRNGLHADSRRHLHARCVRIQGGGRVSPRRLLGPSHDVADAGGQRARAQTRADAF